MTTHDGTAADDAERLPAGPNEMRRSAAWIEDVAERAPEDRRGRAFDECCRGVATDLREGADRIEALAAENAELRRCGRVMVERDTRVTDCAVRLRAENAALRARLARVRRITEAHALAVPGSQLGRDLRAALDGGGEMGEGGDDG